MTDATRNLLEQHFDTAFAAPDLPAGKAGGIAKLRELILTLAMQGKLVEQDQKDPPASELLKEIEAEKQRLTSSSSPISPSSSPRRRGSSKSLPPIKPEDLPYELPQGWEWVRIREICHDWGQKTPAARFTYIDVGAIDNKLGTISSNIQLLDASDAPSRARKIVKVGTVIYSTVRPYLLNIAIVEKEYDPEPIASTAFAILHPFTSLSARFIYHYLKSPAFTRYVESTQKGVAYPAIKDGDFFSGLFPLPPLPEQHRIVARIDQLMTRCDELEKLRKAREAKRLAVHAAAVKQLLDSASSPAQPLSSPPRRRGSSASDSLDSRLRGNDGEKIGIGGWDFLQQHFGELYSVKQNVTELRKAILQLAVMGRLVLPACRQAGKTPTTLPPPKPGAWWVYVIECENGSFYKGFTEDLPRRWNQHLSGTASDWTKKHLPKQVYYWEKCYSKEAAIKREYYLKSGCGREWFKREVVDNEKAWQPASELLKEIEAEKQRLSTSSSPRRRGSNKPLPPIKPEDLPYELPQGWEWVRLGNISLTNDSGWSPQCLPEQCSTGQWGVLKVSAVSWGKYDPDENKALPSDKAPRPECEVKAGDFLLSRANTDELVARSVVVDDTPGKLMMSDKIVRFTFPDYINKRFVNFANGTDFSRTYYMANASGTSSSMKNVSRQVMAELPVPLPPLPEQHRIVARIDQLMALCDTLDRQIDAATGKQTELLNAVMGGFSQ